MLSASVLVGATYIRRLLGAVVEGSCVVMEVCVDVYPEAIAVMVVVPGALLSTVAMV